MHYRDKKTQEILENLDPTKNLDPDDFVYDDLFSRFDILNLIKIYSFDGAQLYQSKKSDMWIGIWVVDDYSPGACYKKKHILPAVVVPGPNKRKNPDSFLFRSFYHVSALQWENNGAGLHVWDGLKEETVNSHVIVILNMADAVALTELDGCVGHHGSGCDHPDIDIRNLSRPSPEIYKKQLEKVVLATDQADYEKKRKERGISKPSIISRLLRN
ncbi:uncharacterized protein LACBIDRAFT_329489 [Laccaria bicolor S238N-H82]|uniref:Predicted protein n=1 Tax=Laccaria bicolor (strain S238N-H82 / ATCC MYA-4686) TaxID=486041 RepID=B0DI70_LACBS|nr:uncharacterized protein LACBIDRAFT_329489 [Laccaria bicolor S238N-H82]EDR05626.1 predicted protein [Laccaria bicolor S238N-H82]|eukprot:XP_001883730.1 predicted protein [Laccaria bicolor S238N-H82]